MSHAREKKNALDCNWRRCSCRGRIGLAVAIEESDPVLEVGYDGCQIPAVPGYVHGPVMFAFSPDDRLLTIPVTIHSKRRSYQSPIRQLYALDTTWTWIPLGRVKARHTGQIPPTGVHASCRAGTSTELTLEEQSSPPAPAPALRQRQDRV